MKLDPYTFGNTLPATILVERLEALNSSNAVRGVSQFLQRGNLTIKHLHTIQEPRTKTYLSILLREDIQRKLEKSVTIPESLRSFVANVLITKLKIIERDNSSTDRDNLGDLLIAPHAWIHFDD